MIAYNNSWLNNLYIREQADEAIEEACIEKEEHSRIEAAYPAGFYTPNTFIRIGLFILTCIIALFGMGFFALLVMDHINEQGIGIFFIVFALTAYIALEVMAHNRHYRSGVDDALTWMTVSFFMTGINLFGSVSGLGNAFIVFFLTAFLFLRFTDSLMATASSLAVLAIVFYSLARLGTVGKAIIPFAIMAASALLYFFARGQLQKNAASLYRRGLAGIKIISLLTLYVAGNYYAVRETSNEMFHLGLVDGQSIPFGWIFWIFTLVLPIVYIIRGLQRRDAVLLRLGMFLVAATVFTVRYYYHFIPAEIAMVIGGVSLIGFAWCVIQYLKVPRNGFTQKQADRQLFMDRLQAESLVITQGFAHTGGSPTPTTQFGGGSGGGGGATGSY